MSSIRVLQLAVLEVEVKLKVEVSKYQKITRALAPLMRLIQYSIQAPQATPHRPTALYSHRRTVPGGVRADPMGLRTAVGV